MSSDDEQARSSNAIIPGLKYLTFFTAESDRPILNHSVVEIIMIFETSEAADDLSRQLALLCQARSECVIYADHIKVSQIAEFDNEGKFRRIYLAPQSAEAANSRHKPSYRSELIMQQLHYLYDLTNVGTIICNISKQQITTRTEAPESALSQDSSYHFMHI